MIPRKQEAVAAFRQKFRLLLWRRNVKRQAAKKKMSQIDTPPYDDIYHEALEVFAKIEKGENNDRS